MADADDLLAQTYGSPDDLTTADVIRRMPYQSDGANDLKSYMRDRAMRGTMELSPEAHARLEREPKRDANIPWLRRALDWANENVPAAMAAANFVGPKAGKLPAPRRTPTPTPDKEFWTAAKPLDAGLPEYGDFKHALDSWVGGPHDAIEQGITSGLMIPGPLERLTPQQMQMLSAPMQELLRERYGDYLTLYRGQRPGGTQSFGRENKLNSFTTDRRTAERFAGVAGKEHQLIDEAAIAAAEKQYAETGEAKLGRQRFQRDPEWGSVNLIDRAGDMITDTPSIRTWAEQENAWLKELNDERAAALKGVKEYRVPTEDVLWATDRFNQREIIAQRQRALEMSPEARLARAREQGFDVDNPLYISSPHPITEFKPYGRSHGHKGISGISLSDKPELAARYLDRYPDLTPFGDSLPKNMMKVYIRPGELREFERPVPMRENMGSWIRDPDYKWPGSLDGVDTAVFPDYVTRQGPVEHRLLPPGGKRADRVIEGKEYILRDPSRVRSVNAAFDPAMKDSANLLAGLAGGAVTTADILRRFYGAPTDQDKGD